MISVEQNLSEEAYRALKKAITLAPENPFYDYALGAVTMQRNVAREPVPYLQKYGTLKPEDPRGKLALGAAYSNSHEMEAAQEQIAPLVDFSETAAAAHYYMGRLANQRGEFVVVIRELQSAISANPRYAEALAELGLMHMKRNEYREAEEALAKALEINPDSYTANLNLMMLYQRAKDPRADGQSRKFQEIKTKRDERAREFLRTIEVRP